MTYQYLSDTVRIATVSPPLRDEPVTFKVETLNPAGQWNAEDAMLDMDDALKSGHRFAAAAAAI